MGEFYQSIFSAGNYAIRKMCGLQRRLRNYGKMLRRAAHERSVRRQIRGGMADALRIETLKRLREKDCISVVFAVDTFPKWKADSLLRLMSEHPRFKPCLRVMKYDVNDVKSCERNEHLFQEYAASLGVPCLSFESYEQLPQGCEADIVFVSEPYDPVLLYCSPNRGLMNHAVCYIPYGFFSIGTERTMNNIVNNLALFNFYENEATRQLAASLMDNGGSNVSITGHTMADAFLFSPDRYISAWKDCGKPMKKVIWAPHWTISNSVNWFACGNFLELADQMTTLAEKYREEIQFAFKPHPLLYHTLCKHPKWGKEKTDAFYHRWAEMPNTQLEEGAYAALFMQSDAIVHDSSSFIIEYMFADKPAMHLVRGEGYQGFSPMAQEALRCYTKGHSNEDVERFLQAVLHGEDPLREQRAAFRKNYLIPPNGCSAAQNVIDCLLGEGAYAGVNLLP